jgi:uncharacterized protein (TIRG00374 family)
VTFNHLRAALGFALGGVFLYLAARHISAAEFLNVLASAKGGWLTLGLGIYWLELGVMVVRWSTLLSIADKKVMPSRTTAAFIIGYAANNVLPARLGELVRVDLIGRMTALSRMAALGTVVVERALDVLVLLLAAGIGMGLLVLPNTGDLTLLRGSMWLLGSVCVLLLIAGVFFVRTRISSRWHLSPLMRSRLRNLLSAVHVLSDPAKCARLLGLSLLIWALNGMALWLIVFALGITLTFLQTMLLLGVAGLSAILPAPPAGLGVLQYAFTLVFGLLRKPSVIGLAASATVQVVLLGSVTLVGALLFFAVVIPLSARRRRRMDESL